MCWYYYRCVTLVVCGLVRRSTRHSNQIVDIRGLIHVPKLARLELADNQVDDIETARAVVLVLSSLKFLSLQGPFRTLLCREALLS